MKYHTDTEKKYFRIKGKKKNTGKPNDRFWKDSFMKVLEAMYWSECTWAIENWKNVGISSSEKRKIEQSFDTYMKNGNKYNGDHFFSKKNESQVNIETI